MAHTPGRSILPPFTRRGPPTEEEERERLRERRQATAAGEAPARSIPRTPSDPAHPTINPPGGRDNGPRSQAELTAADEARARGPELPVEVRRAINERDRIERNRRLREAGLPEEELPSERAERGAFIRAETQRKAEERRDAMGLPPTSIQRREDFRTRAARFALLDGNTEQIPLLQGSLESATTRGQANPDLFPHNQIVRTTVKGRETFQRWNAVRRDFTPVTIDPLTGGIAIDTFDAKALSDAAVADSFNLRIGSLRALAADPDLDPESRKQLEFLATGMQAIKEAAGTAITVDEGLKQAKALYSLAAPFIKFAEDEIPSVLKGLDESVTPVEGFPGFFWTRDDKGNYKLQHAEVEEAGVPSTLKEFLRTDKGFKVYLDTFNDVFNTMTTIAVQQLKVVNDAAQAAFKAGETKKFVPQTATPISVDDAIARTREILGSLFPEQATTTTAQPQQRSGAFPASEIEAETDGFGRRFTAQDFADIAEETGMSEEELRAIAGQ